MPSLRYCSKEGESFSVKYWDRSGEFVKQATQVVYCKTKGDHEAAAQFCMKLFNIKKEDVINVVYQ